MPLEKFTQFNAGTIDTCNEITGTESTVTKGVTVDVTGIAEGIKPINPTGPGFDITSIRNAMILSEIIGPPISKRRTWK